MLRITGEPDLFTEQLRAIVQEEMGDSVEGVNIYIADGTLAGDRIVDLNGHRLDFKQAGQNFLTIQPNVFFSQFKNVNGDIASEFLIQSDNTDFVGFQLNTTNGIANPVSIVADGQASTIVHTSDTHTFNGKVINPDIVAKNFANDTAAASGGVAVGEDYHTNGTKKVRII